jgi:hypothetical protein
LVVHTAVTGFSSATFTAGIRRAYRRAYAHRYNITDVARVVLSNIRDRALRKMRTLAAAAGSVVEFDVQISLNTTAEAEALSALVKGSDATEQTAVLGEFVTELAAVAASGEFADVASSFVPPAEMAVATQLGVVALATGAPTPAPKMPGGGGGGGGGRGGGGSGGVIGGVVGAVFASVAGLALAYRKREQFHTLTRAAATAAAGGGKATETEMTDSGRSDTTNPMRKHDSELADAPADAATQAGVL